MFSLRFKKPFLPISWYLLLFMLIAIVPAVISAHFSVRQADVIQRQAQAQTTKRAQADLLREVNHLSEELTGTAKHLAEWDETRTLFSDATYYNYWKETRAKEVVRYRGLVDAVDLYAASGQPLTGDVTLAPIAYPGAINQPAFVKTGANVHMLYFHPVHNKAVTPPVLLGYIGMRMNLRQALDKFSVLQHSSIQNIDWHLSDTGTTSIGDTVGNALLQVTPSAEVDALSQLVHQVFMEYLGYTIGLIFLLAVLLTFSIARPLTRLTHYLSDIYSGNVSAIPKDFHGAVNILELENVRQALNDYNSRFLSAAATLEQKNKELLHLTYHDVLTGRHNRRAFETRLAHAMQTALLEQQHHVLCYIDLDQFKVVNDTCGHVAGDELLKQVASILHSETRASDMLARLGGDEFGILFEGCELEKALEIAESMRLKVKKYRFVWQKMPFDISISIGLVSITSANADVAEAMKNADAACYVAKDSGRNRVQVYQEHDKDLAQRHGEMQWVSRIKQALEDNRFELHGQLIRPTSDETLRPHCEVLLRLRDEDGRLVPPMAFIPAAERYNLMPAIDLWVIRRAIEMLAAQHAQGKATHLTLAINLSGLSLGNKEVLSCIKQLIEEHKLDSGSLCFEITETAAITNLAAAMEFMRNLRALGCRFALDDFGSGLSSFGYLSNLAVDYIKIDGHFVVNMLTDPLNRSFVSAINEIGHVMGVATIAEFVESTALIADLEKIGIDYVQGFGVHKPEPLMDFLSSPRARHVPLDPSPGLTAASRHHTHAGTGQATQD
jgi:diguanylate cyclase (GGDEF)-like protein